MSQLHDFSPGIAGNGLFWILQIPDDAVKITKDTLTISLTNALVVDQFRFPNGAGNNLGIAGVPATLTLNITYTKSGSPREVVPTSSDALSPFNWEGQMWAATNSGTFSLSYQDGSFSAQGSFDSAGNFGEMGTERNGSFVEREDAAPGLASNALGTPQLAGQPGWSATGQNQNGGAATQNTVRAEPPASGPKFKGRMPISELIH